MDRTRRSLPLLQSSLFSARSSATQTSTSPHRRPASTSTRSSLSHHFISSSILPSRARARLAPLRVLASRRVLGTRLSAGRSGALASPPRTARRTCRRARSSLREFEPNIACCTVADLDLVVHRRPSGSTGLVLEVGQRPPEFLSPWRNISNHDIFNHTTNHTFHPSASSSCDAPGRWRGRSPLTSGRKAMTLCYAHSAYAPSRFVSSRILMLSCSARFAFAFL